VSDSLPIENFFSEGFRNFLEAIRFHGESDPIIFPRECSDSDISIKKTFHAWFKDIVYTHLNGDTRPCAIEEKMAVFAKIRYKRRGNLISYANIQVLIAETDLKTFYRSKAGNCNYLRLDYDLDALGKIFTHPQPHIHISSDRPRFGLMNSSSGNIIIDFFEFIYLNFFSEKWLKWARNAHCRKTEDFGEFDKIVKAFDNSQLNIILESDNYINKIKESCRKQKERLFKFKIDKTKSDILCYTG